MSELLTKIKGFLLTPSVAFKSASADSVATAYQYFVILLVIFSILYGIVSYFTAMSAFSTFVMSLSAIPVVGGAVSGVAGQFVTLIGLFSVFETYLLFLFCLVWIFVAGFMFHIFVLMMGGDPEYGASTMRTTDGGNSWESSLLGILWYPREIGFRTISEGWAPLGPRGTFLFTADSGNSWSEIPTPDSCNITNISFPDSLHGFAVGRFGSIIKYVYQEPNGIAPVVQRNNAYFLAQNFPNPFNPSTKIEYYIPESGMVRLKIYDLLGKEVATLVNGYKEAGSYTINFNTDDLPAGFTKLSNGIYFYRLKAGDYTEVKKMVLLR